jgi:hypothetical protein
MTNRSLLGLAVGALLAALAAGGCTKKDEGSAKGPPAGAEPKRDAYNEPLGAPEVTVTPAEWHAEFKKDSKAATAKYKGKVVELAGEVSTVSGDPYDNVGYVFLKVPGDILGVRCATRDKKPWVKVSPGSQVKVRGRISGTYSTGDLDPAEITEAGPNPGVVISAQQLAKEFAADRKAAREKYDNKSAYVDGEITEKGSSQYCGIQLKLKGEGDAYVSCCFGKAANTKPLESAKPGQKVKVFGTLSVIDGEKQKEVYLNTCELTELQ